MYNLNKSITNWKLAMSRKGACSKDEMQELEAHLREQVADLVDVGLSEQEAFSVGVSRLGVLNELCAEYAKASPMRIWRHRLCTLLLAAPAVGIGAFVAVFLLPKAQLMWEQANMDGAPQWLLATPLLIFESLFLYGHYALIAVVAAMILFDSRATSWSRYRFLPFGVIAFSVNVAVLVAIATTCTAIALVAPALP